MIHQFCNDDVFIAHALSEVRPTTRGVPITVTSLCGVSVPLDIVLTEEADTATTCPSCMPSVVAAQEKVTMVMHDLADALACANLAFHLGNTPRGMAQMRRYHQIADEVVALTGVDPRIDFRL